MGHGRLLINYDYTTMLYVSPLPIPAWRDGFYFDCRMTVTPMDATTDQPEASTSSAPPQETTVRFIVDGPEELPSTSPVRKRRKPKTRTDDASNTVPPPSATTNLAVPNTVTEEIASQAM